MLSSVWLFLKHPLPWLLCQHFPQVVFPHLPSLKLLFNLLCIHYLGPDYKCLSCSRCRSALTSSVASRLTDLPSCLSSAPPLRCCNSIANSVHPAEFILFPIPLGPSPVETPSTGSYKSEPETLYQVVPLHPQHIIKSIDIGFKPIYIYTYQFSSVTQSCLTLCEPMDCSTPGFPVHHQVPVLTQTHVHWVSDAIQPSHLLSSPSPPVFNLYQHQGLFPWVSSLHQVAKVLEFQL